MKIKFAWFLPVLVFFTDKELKGGYAGKSWGPVIVIRTQYKDDRGLLAHELNHSKQWYITLSLWSWFYKFNAKVRYLSEVGCYKKQLRYVPPNLLKKRTALFATFITTRYGLNVDVNDVIKDLNAKPKYWLWG